MGLVSLLFILSVTSLTVYQVREKQIYEGEAKESTNWYFCYKSTPPACLAIAGTAFSSLTECAQFVAQHWTNAPTGACYLTKEKCQLACGVTSTPTPTPTPGGNTPTPTPTTPSNAQKMYYCNIDYHPPLCQFGEFLSLDSCRKWLGGTSGAPNTTGACWQELSGCQNACKAGQQMYVCNTQTKECIGTTNLYTDVNVCAANVKEYITNPNLYPNTGTCYRSEAECQGSCNPTPEPKVPSSTPTPISGRSLKGDINADSCINSIDLGMIIDYYNPSAPASGGSLVVDLNDDSYINAIDLGILIDNYNPTGPNCQ